MIRNVETVCTDDGYWIAVQLDKMYSADINGEEYDNIKRITLANTRLSNGEYVIAYTIGDEFLKSVRNTPLIDVLKSIFGAMQ